MTKQEVLNRSKHPRDLFRRFHFTLKKKRKKRKTEFRHTGFQDLKTGSKSFKNLYPNVRNNSLLSPTSHKTDLFHDSVKVAHRQWKRMGLRDR